MERASRSLGIAAALTLWLAGAGCSRVEKPREMVLDTTLEGRGGIYAPHFGFLFLETEERDQYTLAKNASEPELELYRGIVLQGCEAEAPKTILARRKLAATTSLLLEQPGSSLPIPLAPDLFRYDYAVCQGLLRQAREDLFGTARCWQSGGVVALPLWTAGAASPEEDWALLYLENGAVTTLPRPGIEARPLVPPLAAGTVKRGGDQVLQVALGSKGALVAALRRSGLLYVVDQNGVSMASENVHAWDMAWHPALPILYVASSKGLKMFAIGNGHARAMACRLPNGVMASALSVSPDGSLLLLYPAGGVAKLFSVSLDARGEPVGGVKAIPGHAPSASSRVWEPFSHVLWCFDANTGQAWRVDGSTGAVLQVWSWPKERASLDAKETGERPAVTLTYGVNGYPSWQRFTAYLDPQSMKFVGLSEPSPLEGISWKEQPRGQ